jgi:hypothetical protein
MALADPEKSKIKMVILTKPKEENKVWYSPVKQNKKPEKTIIEGMLRRFQNSSLFAITNVVQFYDMETNSLIAKFTK